MRRFSGSTQSCDATLPAVSTFSAITLVGWIRPIGTQTGVGALSYHVTGTTANPAILLQRNGANTARWYLNGNYRDALTITVTDGVLAHIGLRWNGATWESFLNGRSVGTYDGGMGFTTSTAFQLGNGFNGYAQVDWGEVAISPEYWSAEEIYRCASGVEPPEIARKLLAYWPLGGRFGQTDADCSPRRLYPLTLTGSPTWCNHPPMVRPIEPEIWLRGWTAPATPPASSIVPIVHHLREQGICA